VLGNDPEAVN